MIGFGNPIRRRVNEHISATDFGYRVAAITGSRKAAAAMTAFVAHVEDGSGIDRGTIRDVVIMALQCGVAAESILSSHPETWGQFYAFGPDDFYDRVYVALTAQLVDFGQWFNRGDV